MSLEQELEEAIKERKRLIIEKNLTLEDRMEAIEDQITVLSLSVRAMLDGNMLLATE